MQIASLYSELGIPPLAPGESIAFTPLDNSDNGIAPRLATVSWARDLEGGPDLIEVVAFTAGDLPEELLSAIFEVAEADRVDAKEISIHTLSPDEERRETEKLAKFMQEFRGHTANMKREKVSAA
jgi:hypothetical protein